MKSKVYFIKTSDTDDAQTIELKLIRLLGESKVLDFIQKDEEVALKMHFGEEGNTGYVRPEYVRVVCDSIKKKLARPFLADTNTLYRGRRMNSGDHLQLAYEHGFTICATGVEVLIPDDSKKENISEIVINKKFVKKAKICKIFSDADAIVGIAHFKGHIMTGFGGALKNLGMGCATREGKLAQHSHVSPFVKAKKCVSCMACEKVCPVNAITTKNDKACIDRLKCVGCATCIAVCIYNAIDLEWEVGGSNIQERMIEYVSAIFKEKKERAGFLNFAIKITKECDCLAKDDPRIAPDIGILACRDPVSIDKATLDSVNKACGKDIFKEVQPSRDGLRQLKYASDLGLGSLDYELIEVS